MAAGQSGLKSAVKRTGSRKTKESVAVKPVTDVRATLNMRIRPEIRGLIDDAAKLAGKNRTDFVLDAARQAAQDTLLDRRTVPLSAAAYRQFVTLLDAPPRPNPRLLKSLQTPAVWE